MNGLHIQISYIDGLGYSSVGRRLFKQYVKLLQNYFEITFKITCAIH